MKYCNACNLKVDTPLKKCPLCYSQLVQYDNNEEIAAFPNHIADAKKNNIIIKILLFLSITVSSVCAVVNFTVASKSMWSLIVIVIIGYLWIAGVTALKLLHRLGNMVILQLLSLSAFLIFIDEMANKRLWALNYVVPILFIVAMLFITIVLIIKRVNIERFILYFFIIAFLGFIPIIIYALKITNVGWPAVVSATYSGISLISIFIFADSQTKVELKKRFHI